MNERPSPTIVGSFAPDVVAALRLPRPRRQTPTEGQGGCLFALVQEYPSKPEAEGFWDCVAVTSICNHRFRTRADWLGAIGAHGVSLV